MNKRESFSSTLAVFLATLGSAVGLGNIWKFPSVLGNNGGGAFILVYICCLLLIGIPILVSEFLLGFSSKVNVLSMPEKMKVSKFWKIIGYMGIASAFLIMFFYTSIAGLVYSYVFKAIGGIFNNTNPDLVSGIFAEASLNPLHILFWQIVVIVVVCTITIAGVKKGIERVTKILMPILLGLLVMVAVISLTLPDAMIGVKFLLEPDFSKITASVVLSAMGLAFFKISLGIGTMMTYASYFNKDTNLLKTACSVAFADMAVSVLAGLAIFPALFSFGFAETGGPSLLFITIPMVFSKIVGGQFLTIAFFILCSIAATTAIISMIEVPVAYLSESRNMSRLKANVISGIIIVMFGSLAALSIDSSAVLGGIKIMGLTIFDLYDFITSNLLMPLGGIFIALLCARFIDKRYITDSLGKVSPLYIKILCFVSLPAIALIFVTTFINAFF